MNETEDISYEGGAWVALTQRYVAPHIIPVRVGKEAIVPFGAVGKIVSMRIDTESSETSYDVAFHAGWVALGIPGKFLRPARMLEQLALCADGC